MKHFLTIIGCLFILGMSAQERNFKEFYKSHKRDAEVSLNVPGFIANLFIDTDGDRELKTLLRKAKNYKVLVFDDDSRNVQKDLKRFIRRNNFKTIVRIKDGKDRISIHFKETKNRIKEIIVNIYKKNDDVVLFGLKTNLTKRELQKIISRYSYTFASK